MALPRILNTEVVSMLYGKPNWRGGPLTNVINGLTLGRFASDALVMGSGKSASNFTSSLANKNFLSFYFTSSAINGTARGMYLRTYLTGGAGGEALRAFNTVSNNTPADTVNGAHISLNFGSSAGNIVGEGFAVRATFHVPGRAINGTWAALQAEIYGDAANGAVGGAASFLRMLVDGNANLKDSWDDNGFLFSIQGLTAGAAHLFKTGCNAATVNAATTATLRIRIGATTYYLPVATAN